MTILRQHAPINLGFKKSTTIRFPTPSQPRISFERAIDEIVDYIIKSRSESFYGKIVRLIVRLKTETKSRLQLGEVQKDSLLL
jgi:hypothetical protein